jgi:hypothetical protein
MCGNQLQQLGILTDQVLESSESTKRYLPYNHHIKKFGFPPARLALKLRPTLVLILGYQTMTRLRLEQEEKVLTAPGEERRGAQRIQLQVPLFIRGNDAHGQQFMELAKALNISSLGALITCPRALSVNGVLTLTVPAPSISSTALAPTGMPPIQARVKRQHQVGDVHVVGVEFLEPLD